MILIAMALGAAQPAPPPQPADRVARREAPEPRTQRLIELEETVNSLSEARRDAGQDQGPQGL